MNDKDVLKKLGASLRRLRHSKDLTQQQLAEKIDVKKVTVSSYESGERAPSLDKLLKIADCFQISLDILFEREEFQN